MRLVAFFIVPILFILTWLKSWYIVELNGSIPQDGALIKSSAFAGTLLLVYFLALVAWQKKIFLPLGFKTLMILCQCVMAVYVLIDWFGSGM